LRVSHEAEQVLVQCMWETTTPLRKGSFTASDRASIKMKIAQLATNVERVPPEGYGGTELVVHLLTEELVRRGHEVTLFATGDSQTSARLISTVDSPLRTDDSKKLTQWAAYDMSTCLKLTGMQTQFDIIHNHLGYHALPFLDQMTPQVVSTNHNPVKPYCEDIYFAYGHQSFVSISESYRRLNFPDLINYVATVYNGIDIDAFKADPNVPRDYLLFVGRLGHDKGTAEAIDIAKALDMPIKLAGKVDSNDLPYFETEVQPRLSSYSKAEYVGEVNHEQKRKLYGGAKAVVYPINFDEPFGLVMAESMAAGTPVMALERGSVREIIIDKITGVVAQNVEELIRRFPEIQMIKTKDCVDHVRKNFSVKHMVDGYEQIYSKLLDKKLNREEAIAKKV
jgi:glycosyltransferase involved in cell wall biosynthesis